MELKYITTPIQKEDGDMTNLYRAAYNTRWLKQSSVKKGVMITSLLLSSNNHKTDSNIIDII